MKGLFNKVASILLVTLLLLTSVIGTNVVRAEENEEDGTELNWTVVENDSQRIADKLNKVESFDVEETTSLRGNVRVSILLEADSTLNAGFSTENIGLDPNAISYRESLERQQDDIAAVISRDVLGGAELDVVWNLTFAANIISANVPADKIDEIKAINGVKDVIVETLYYPETDEVSDEPNMSVSTEMTSAQYAWASGYTGAGSKVAIVDTGLDVDHQAFDHTAFDMSIQEIESRTGKQYDLLDEHDISKIWGFTNAAKVSGADYKSAYLNSKVPFAFNYVDTDFDVTHLNDTQGEHGSHVASIAAANKYLYNKNGDGSVTLANALKEVYSQGNAPDAQVLVMKVFGKGGGAYDSDYFAAIEDAILLGADSVNLSLGSSAAGFTRNSTYQEIIDGITGTNIIWANSAGNNGSWADQTGIGYLYSDGANLATGGSPATYSNTMSVASVNNDGQTGPYLDFYGENIFYTESSGFSNSPMITLGGQEFEYVYIDNYGTEADFNAVASVLSGKIAICNRGSISFYVKANAAASLGAAAVLIVNNEPGTISMDLTDYQYRIPVVSITQNDGEFIKYYSEEKTIEENGAKYFTGKITVSTLIDTVHYDSNYYEMSSFSSYGVPGDLSIKPEITTPGGNIYAAFGVNKTKNGSLVGGHDAYENMSGTSMASPQLAGIAAVMAQYAKDSGLDLKAKELGITKRALIQSLLMSTSEPLIEKESGSYYSVLKQGSGLADLEAAINSKIVVLMDSTSVNGESRKDISSYAKDGKVKAELGDDPDRSGRYSVVFTLNNVSNKDLYYDLDADFFTQYLFQYRGNLYLHTWTYPLTTSLSWFIDGVRFVKQIDFDFNGDQIFNEQDGQAILDYVAGLRDNLNDIGYADLDNDGEITTYDAYQALKLANQGAALVPANSSIKVRVDIALSPDEIAMFDDKGAYVEGYIYAAERESEDGAFGVVHSIPVLGYYGSWSDPSMIDVGSVLEYQYGHENRYPYMSVSTALGSNALYAQALIVKHNGLNANYAFGGNPAGSALDGYEYRPERNAINSKNTFAGAQYSLIRNSAGYSFEVSDKDGELVNSKEGRGNMYAAYYSSNDRRWSSTVSSISYGYMPSDFKEGESGVISFSLAPEYYLTENGIRWEDVSPEWEMPFVVDDTAPSITSVSGKRVYGEEEIENEDGTTSTVETNNVVVTVSAQDNEYIAAMFLYDEEDNLLFYRGSRQDVKQEEFDTQKYEISLDGTKVLDHIYVELWDYAANITTIEINLNKDELNDPVTIALDRTYVKSVVGNSVKLNATLRPWGLDDQTVSWSSDNENIAVVNEKGVVTGIAEGTAVITVTANADPEKKASCQFEFFKVNRTLNAAIWDEEGEVWFSEFNTSTLPDYKKLSGSMRMELASMSYAEDGLLYGATLDTSSFTSSLYTIDENTYETTLIGPSQIAYMDLCPAPSFGGSLYAVYGTYLVVLDRSTGDYLGVLDLKNYTNGNSLIGIALEEQYYYEAYDMSADWFFLLDETGELYSFAISEYGSLLRPQTYDLGNLGYSTDTQYFNSLYYDGTDLYWSRFVYDNDKVDIIYVQDLYEDGSIYNLGSFADKVWPVGGLFNSAQKGMVGINSSDRHADATVVEDVTMLAEIPERISGSRTPKGGLDVTDSNETVGPISKEEIKTEIEGDDDAESKEVRIVLTADDVNVTTNGLYEVSYDPDILKFSYAKTDLPYYAVNSADGSKVVFAFADKSGVATDDTIAVLVFERLDTHKTVVSVSEKESGSAVDIEADPIEYKVADPTEDFGEILEEDRPENETDIPDGLWISKLGDVYYTGKAIQPEFRVYDHKKLLTLGKDYTVSYANNTIAGKATVTVTGKGNYTGKTSSSFNILPAEINDSNTVIVLNKDAFVYNKNKQKAKVTGVIYNGLYLTGSKDFKVTYENENSSEEGVYGITVTGTRNYTGEMKAYYIISSDIKPVSGLSISGIKNQPYTGSEITQDIVVKSGKTVLEENKDYTVKYRNNVNAGVAYVTISGLGEYVGSVTKTFNISRLSLNAKNTTLEGLETTYRYAGTIAPEIKLSFNGKELVEGEDYTVTFKNNDKAGNATVTLKGAGNYTGTFNKTFKIMAINLNEIRVADVPEQVYVKGGSKPDVDVFDTFNNVALVLGKDYTLSYKNNQNLGTATVTVKGKGNYTGSVAKNFEVKVSDISKLTLTAADKTYVNKKNQFTTTVTVIDVNGNKLAAGTDYEKNVAYTYAQDTQISDNLIRKAGEAVDKDDIIPAGTTINVTVTGKGKYTGTLTGSYRFATSNISAATVNIPNQIYTGKEIQLDKAEVTVKINKTTLTPDDFVIVSYQNNINKGTAKVTIKGVGNYGGTKTVNFKIVEKSFLNALWILFQ